MSPEISKISELDQQYKFTLSDIDVSLANALRRTILSDIPVTGFYTENYKNNRCNIEVNTTRLHNELLKHRLSSIPVHIKDMQALPDKYELELHVKNDGDDTIYVTTEDFKIKSKETKQYLSREKVQEIFPPSVMTNHYIDFVRLRPSLGNIPGEEIKLTADFSVHTAKESGVYNVVSKCAYGNTIDLDKAASVWDDKEKSLKAEQLDQSEIDFQKKNFYILDVQKYYKENSFDFTVQSIGIYSHNDLIVRACQVLIEKFTDIIKNINSNLVSVIPSQTTMDNCFDIKLENEDYTIGKLIEFHLFDKLFSNVLCFIGFKKYHPHDVESVLRLAYKDNVDKQMINSHLIQSCTDAIMAIKAVQKLF
tara:strand:+ start:1309 stop:2403 length:1095 start_codon:yes stop_codon:yes gene_type:complete